MKKSFLRQLFTALLLLCGTVASAQDFPLYFGAKDGLPGTAPSGSSQKQWESGTLNFGNEVNGLRITVFTTNSNQKYNNFPMTALAELEFYDGDGNKIEYTADDVTTNSLESSEGSLAALCDGNYSTFYHSTWQTGTTPDSYVYVEVQFPQAVTTVNIKLVERNTLNSLMATSIGVTEIGVLCPLGTLSGTCGDNTYWELDNGVLSIGGEGAITNNSWELYSNSINEVVIGEGVTGIGNYAFRNCSSLTSITIPNSVISIKTAAFEGCSSLTSIEIPNSVTSIGNYAFSGCTGLTGITIPNSVTSIGGSAFSGCIGLTGITIPNSVTSIGGSAFSGCTGLTGITIPNSVTSIGNYAFSGCTGLTGITIPNSITSIGGSAFRNCSSLTSVTIPNSVISMGDYAFSGCSSLTSIEIPNCVTSIEAKAFEGCSSLTNVTIPNSVTSIGDWAFLDCSSLTSIEIPNSVTNIRRCAFMNCSGLTGVTIPNGVTAIEHSVFFGCNALTSVTIPNSVTSIGGSAFEYCTGLTSVTIPNSVTSIGGSAFRECSGLTSVTIPNSVTSIGNSAFDGCYGLKEVHINDISAWCGIAFGNDDANPLYYAEALYLNNELQTNIVIPENVAALGSYTFVNVDAFFTLEATTPPIVTSSTFASYASFAVPVTALDTYKNDANWATYASKIVSADKAVLTLDVTAEEGASALLKEIGDANTTSVCDLTIKGSINSYDVIILRDKMPNLRSLDISEAAVVASSKAFYETYCTGENDLGDYAFYNLSNLLNVKLPNDLVRIGYRMFSDCGGLKTVTMGNSVTSIGGSAFYNCYGLTGVTIPNSVTSIGDWAFYNCGGLKTVTMGNSVKSIGSHAFYNCDGLTSVTISNSVTSIGSHAFYSCGALANVAMGNSVKSIGSQAFYQCGSLKEIKLSPTLQTVGSYAFYGCRALTEVRLPSSILSVAGSAFSDCNAIKNVYTYTIEPTSIEESTFTTSVFQNSTLHVPSTSYWNYYWDDGWKRFLNLSYFDEPYDYFYLNNDYTLDEETGYIDGTPDVDINAGGGLVVEGETSDNEDVKQELGDVNINHDGSGTSGSIIGDNNVHAENLNIRINIKGGRWYFFAFPFDIPFSKISMENGTQYVFRYYDGEERAKNGEGGWKDINENHLKAARGYIFQAAADDVLVLNIADVRFKKEDKYNELVEHVTENLQDASWNFTGNPYLSYYDINNLGYDAPITIWNGTSYEAIRPGDDDYHFAPFEAFFVQKPEDKGSVDFNGDDQTTHKKAQATQAANAARRAGAPVARDRKLVNIAISGENATADRTRVVFNDKQSLAYETACDAVKFESDAAAQLYTLDNKNVRYAINERPVGNGTVPVGVKLANSGRYTISAERMDTAVLLKDEKTGTVHNLAEGAYTFIADAGTDEARFALVFNGGTTGIEGAVAADAVAAVDGGVNIENAAGAVVEIYTAAGAVVVSDVVSGYVALPAGAYIVKINGNSIKVAVK